MSNQEPYCGDTFRKIEVYYYENIYINITIPICLMGMILNLLNLLVFTRKTMKSTPNMILAHLAFVDFLYLQSQIVKFWIARIHFNSVSDLEQYYGWTIVYKYNSIFTSTVQFISIFLTVQLATWRYIAVVHPLKGRNWCTKKITRNVVITGYVICFVSHAIPYYLSLDFAARNTNGKTYYIARMRNPITYSIRAIFYGVMKVLFPLVLAGLTSRIVVALLARNTHREQLSPSASTRCEMRNVETRQKTNRSTAILLAVVALFFIGEFPRGILRLLRMIDERDWGYCYKSLVQIFMTITLINTSITFMAYYTLSQQFRTTFKSLFNRNKRAIPHPTNTPLATVDNEETESGRKTSQV